MCQVGQRFDEKMSVLSVFCVYDKIIAYEPDSPCFTVNTTQTSLHTGSESHLFAAGTLANHLTPDFLSCWNFHFVPAVLLPVFPPAVGMCTSTKARGCAGKGQASLGHSEEPAGQWKVTALSCCRSCPAPREM